MPPLLADPPSPPTRKAARRDSQEEADTHGANPSVDHLAAASNEPPASMDSISSWSLGNSAALPLPPVPDASGANQYQVGVGSSPLPAASLPPPAKRHKAASAPATVENVQTPWAGYTAVPKFTAAGGYQFYPSYSQLPPLPPGSLPPPLPEFPLPTLHSTVPTDTRPKQGRRLGTKIAKTRRHAGVANLVGQMDVRVGVLTLEANRPMYCRLVCGGVCGHGPLGTEHGSRTGKRRGGRFALGGRYLSIFGKAFASKCEFYGGLYEHFHVGFPLQYHVVPRSVARSGHYRCYGQCVGCPVGNALVDSFRLVPRQPLGPAIGPPPAFVPRKVGGSCGRSGGFNPFRRRLAARVQCFGLVCGMSAHGALFREF